ncbi:hypothetical protein ABES03_15990 [Neobacillus rhizosphaerae]|uniref:hypothetical protein n=1 Tax=Neobacillus rhizosphaerae TaxID=2880965 RepID=UPI003D2994E6
MAIWDYQLILFPKGNIAELTEEGMDFIGPYFFEFNQAINILERIDEVKGDKSLKSWDSFDDECYFLYDDGTYKVEIELNTGTKSQNADCISIRTNIDKGDGCIVKALKICNILSESLNLSCWNMKLGGLIELNNNQDVKKTINHFNKLKSRTF